MYRGKLSWAGIILGPLWTIGFKVWEGYQMTSSLLGLPMWLIQTVGEGIFFFAVIGLILGYRNQQLGVTGSGVQGPTQSSPNSLQVLILIGACSLLLGVAVGSQLPPSFSEANEETWYKKPRDTVKNRVFRNTEVIMDGKSFVDCTFENVTFQYNGTAPVDMIGNKIIGTRVISSKNPGIQMTVKILREGILFMPDVKEFE